MNESQAEFELAYREFIQRFPQDGGTGDTSTRSQAILLLLQGVASAEVVELLQISEGTLRKYRSQASRHFEVKNFAALQELFDRHRQIWDTELSQEKVAENTETSVRFNNIPNRIVRIASPLANHHPIGRDRDLDRIFSSLDKHDLVWLKGMGGCGKTTLLLEIAHRCLVDLPAKFEAIVYISAQTESWSYNRRIALPARRTHQDIYRQIFTTFNCGEVMYASLEDGAASSDRHLHDRLCQLLAQYRTLLIFDNFDTQENYFILRQVTHQLPAQTRILVGSREVFDASYHLEELKTLRAKDAQDLVKARLQKRQYKLSDVNIQRIVKYTAGLPLAIEIVVGLTAIPGRTERDLERFLKTNPVPQDLLAYCLDNAIDSLQADPRDSPKGTLRERAYDILKTITLFPTTAPKAAVMKINHLDRLPLAFDREIQKLVDLSLIIPDENERYGLHPIVRAYVSRLLAAVPPIHNQLRARWVEWYYKEFARDYDDTNWLDWQDYSAIEAEWQNICALMDWCFDRDLYRTCLDFWRVLKGFTLFRGRWEEREQWLECLIAAAQIEGDANALPLVQYHQSLTLAYRDESDLTGKARFLAQSAWESGIDLEDRFYIATHLAALYLKQADPSSLALAEKLLTDAGNLKPQLSARDLFVIEYYRGEIAARARNFDLALSRYQQALKLAQSSQYRRYIEYTQGRIGGVLTELGRFDEAEVLLINVLTELSKERDARAIAFCQLLLTNLKLKQGQKDGWLKWRSLAIASFEKLNMQNETKRAMQMQFSDRQ